VDEQKSCDALEILTRGHGDAPELAFHVTPTEICAQLEMIWQTWLQILTPSFSMYKLKVNMIL
jgi:hypothetical protein